jgi:hypothetical protein
MKKKIKNRTPKKQFTVVIERALLDEANKKRVVPWPDIIHEAFREVAKVGFLRCK